MALELQKKGNKYRWYSTIAEGFLTVWLDKKAAINYLAIRWQMEAKEKIAQERKNFPKGWIDHDDKKSYRKF